jgi:LCP family protein required for cell wall assembly
MTFRPSSTYVGALSIPRDLWVEIPGYGANRINTAHFFAELGTPGSGLKLARSTVETQFSVDIDGSVSLDFALVQELVDSAGGITIELAEAMSGYGVGSHKLDGEAALAFIRDRAASDDFARMGRAQIFLRAFLKRVLSPEIWFRIPSMASVIVRNLESDVAIWEWPRIAISLLRVGSSGIDGRILDRSLAQGFTTAEGAQVLAPQWNLIRPVVTEMFEG